MLRADAAPDPLAELPIEPVSRLIKPIQDFLQIEVTGGIALLAATSIALIFANSPWADFYLALWQTPVGIQFGSLSAIYSLRHAIDDGLMTLFFFVVGLEIKRELVLGELGERRFAALPAAAALGGMIVPAAIYLALQLGEPGERGWGMVMATDIAFVVGCLAVLGERVPHSLRIFVLSLAIIDDIGAVLVIAIAYSAELDFVALGLGSVAIGLVIGLRYLGVRSVPTYVAIGLLAWLAVHESGIHPTIVGVVLGLLTPVYPWVGTKRFQAIMRRVVGQPRRGNRAAEVDILRSVATAARETISPLERLESALHPWVSFVVLPAFALANAGVPLTFRGFADPLALAAIAGLVLGKPIGILGGSWLAVRLGLAAKPDDVRWPAIAAAGVLCGIGFTMALFIANLAFGEELHAVASLGILAASLISAVAGLGLLAAFLQRRPIPARGNGDL